MLSTAAIAWLPWRAESFARARAEGRPVLLFLAPSWCGHSAEMDSATFADTEVAALVTAHFVAIRVDPDRRPDIAERYSLGGWPKTAFLTPDGDVLGGGTEPVVGDGPSVASWTRRLIEAATSLTRLSRCSLISRVNAVCSRSACVSRMVSGVGDRVPQSIT